MADWTLDTQISRESKAMLKEVKKFTGDLIRPSGISLDKVEKPYDLYQKESVLWQVFKAYRELDLHLMQIPSALGGMDGVAWLTLLLIREEMGYADVGISLSLLASDLPFIYASGSSSPELIEMAKAYCEDKEAKMTGALSLNDPFFSNPSLRAEKKGNGYLVNGIMERVANGNFATHALVHLSMTAEKTGEGETALALLPLDLPGITRNDPLEKLGQRTLNSTTLSFKDVPVPDGYFLTHDPALLNRMKKELAREILFDVSLFYSGLALAAFDEGLAYSKERVQGGVPIFEHKNIKLKLFKLFQMVDASRAYARSIAAALSHDPLPVKETHVVSLKSFATQIASDISCEVIQIFGGNGLAREYPVEKLFRDAQTGRVENGVNEWMAIRCADDL